VDLSTLHPYLLAPLYIMVTANLVHMHSDHNGMPVYTSLIVMASLVAVAFKEDALDSIRFVLPLFGVSLAFSYYNFYPSRILQGNIGAMLGSSLGIVIVLLGLEFIGLVMLLPHIVNFLIYLYWRVRRVPHVLYAWIREDGTLEVPRPLTLKWVLPYYFRKTEEESILSMYVLTAIFCSIGILLA
jgi:UDP-N-acetylglucosamine--dolichyl-phosphate N-acetylglucosaminephosphotransferase